MKTSTPILPIAIFAAVLLGVQWYQSGATGNEMCINYGHELGAMWAEAAERIRDNEIKSESDLFKFADEQAEESRKRIFSDALEPRFESVKDANKGSWNAGDYAELCERLAAEFGE